MTKTKENKKEEVEIIESHSKMALAQHLKDHKKEHLNFQEQKGFICSTGSLKLDIALGGGFTNGTSRLVGTSGSGKSSEALEMMRNFLNTVPNSKAFCVPAEGRLKKTTMKRSGVTFTEDPSKWDTGTCFVLNSNVYEAVLTIVKDMMVDNPENIQYFFLIDSIDALILRKDLDKDFDEATKVAGGPVLMSLFYKHVGLISERAGHHICLISQERNSSIQVGHGHAPPPKMKASGGNAVRHYADIILQYEENYQKNLDRETEKKDTDFFENKIVGKDCKVKIIKSMSETSDTTVTYPVRYYQKDGNSIWREKEILEVGLYLGYVTKPAMGKYLIHEDVINEMREKGLEIHQSFEKNKNENQFLELLSTHSHIKDYMFVMIKEAIKDMNE